MEDKIEHLLLEIAKAYGQDALVREALKKKEESLSRKTADQNPLENSMWENMIDGALKGLEIVAVASLDWRLMGIVKLLQSWLSEKREERRKRQMDLTKGVNYTITHPQFEITTQDPYGGRYTY